VVYRSPRKFHPIATFFDAKKPFAGSEFEEGEDLEQHDIGGEVCISGGCRGARKGRTKEVGLQAQQIELVVGYRFGYSDGILCDL
jgi:hypothetical protein